MKSVLLKLPDELVSRSDECAVALSISRAEYVRRAIEHMNKEIGDAIRAERIKNASLKVREESMRVNAEFAAIEEDLDA